MSESVSPSTTDHRAASPASSPAPARAAANRASAALLAEHTRRGARIRRLLRLLLVAFFVGALITEPPAQWPALCWAMVGLYAAWSLVSSGLAQARWERSPELVWLALLVDVSVVAGLALITDASAQASWTPYLILNGFFLIPVMAAAQLEPRVCAVVSGLAAAVYLTSGLLIRPIDAEPLSYVVLRTAVLAAVGLGASLLSALQRSRVEDIAGLLGQRASLIDDLVALEDRERRSLAEALHDGALQYVLAARLELDDAADGQPEAIRRIEAALAQASTLLRSTTSQLHPAVLETAGLASALDQLARDVRGRGRIDVDLDVQAWPEQLRTAGDPLLFAAARELVANVVKHAHATRLELRLALQDGRAALRVADDGSGMAGVDLAASLAGGHLGVASRRTRIEAAGGSMAIRPRDPHGTIVEVSVPVTVTRG